SLLPNGKLFIASPEKDNNKNYLFDPETETLTPAGDDQVPESERGSTHGGLSWAGSGVLLPLVPRDGSYPQMRFGLTNGKNAYVKELGEPSPRWQVMGTRPSELGSPPPFRTYANATLLPTGQVVVTGGINQLIPALFPPDPHG